MFRGKKKNSGQALVEFVLFVPLLLIFLVGVLRISTLALNNQKLHMAAYYAARSYSKYSIRGIKLGTKMQLYEKRQEIIDARIVGPIWEYLGSQAVKVLKADENKIELEWPITLNFYNFQKEFTLRAHAEMENDSLEFGGGRSADTGYTRS
ncbi:TadE family protein [bacterium]